MSSNNKPKDNPDLSLKQQAETRLNERGILDSASSAGWRIFTYQGIPGWSYPIYDPVSGEIYRNPKNGKPILRWKNFDKDEQGGDKYGWPFGQKSCPPYYVLPGTREAIEAAGGLAYIAAGEVDVLTYISAGLANVFCWLNGEGSVPNDLVEMAKGLGIKRLIYLVDRDETGEKSAQTTAKRLSGSSIEFTSYHLPDSLGDKGDINDLWQRVAFDAKEFRDTFSAIQQSSEFVIVPERADGDSESVSQMPTSPKSRPKNATPNSAGIVDWNIERNEWIRSEVMPRLDQIAPVVKREGRAERRKCPNQQHPDKHPSFRISYDVDSEVGIPQCTCLIQHQERPWDMVAQWVGARRFEKWFAEERQHLYSRSFHMQNRSTEAAQEVSSAQHHNSYGAGKFNPPTSIATAATPLSPLPFTDMGNAVRLARRHGENLRYLTDSDKWIIWTGTSWELDHIGKIVELAKDTVKAIPYAPS